MGCLVIAASAGAAADGIAVVAIRPAGVLKLQYTISGEDGRNQEQEEDRHKPDLVSAAGVDLNVVAHHGEVQHALGGLLHLRLHSQIIPSGGHARYGGAD